MVRCLDYCSHCPIFPASRASVRRTNIRRGDMSRDAVASLSYLDLGARTTTRGAHDVLYQDFASKTSNVSFVAGTPEVIRDASRADDEFSLDSNGFQWVHRPTAMQHEDFCDDAKLTAIYHAEVGDLIKQLSNADHVWIFSSRVSDQALSTPKSADLGRVEVLPPAVPIDQR